MKKIIIILFYSLPFSLLAQEYVNPPGLNKFTGLWQSVNGNDTIVFRSVVRYSGSQYIQVKGIRIYYTYKKGNRIVVDNVNNVTDVVNINFGGTLPSGPALDTLIITGRDPIKRKHEQGYLIINAAGDQLTFMRNLELTGGGMRMIMPGEEPLPGFTLPDTIVFDKYIPEPLPIDRRVHTPVP